MISKYRLIGYTPFGATIGQITHPSTWSFGPTYNEIPGAGITYRDDMPNADRLQSVIEVGFEYSTDGVTWLEPPNSRYLRLGRGRVVRGKDKVRKYTLTGLGHLLKKARQSVSTGLNADGKRMFNSANAGTILKTLIDENKLQSGSMTGITYDFSTTLDSNGQAWAQIISIGYEPGLDFYTILDNLSNQGMVDWYFQGRQLRIFNPSFLAVTKPVALTAGIDIEAEPVEASLDEMVHDVTVLGDGGIRLNLASSYSPPVYWGRWQGFVGNGGVSDTGTMNILADQLLHDGSREKVQYTAELSTKKTTYEPFRDFVPGNSVTAPNEAGTTEAFRIYAINVARAADGKLSVGLVINDRFVESEIGKSKRVIGITGGATAGGSGTSPAPPEPGKRVPATPTGVTVGSVCVPNVAGFPRAIATVDWPDVTTDNVGVALDIDQYEVQAFLGASATAQGWGVSGGSVLSKDNLDPGSQWNVQVRAISASGVHGLWSTPKIAHTMQTDSTPPGVPMYQASDLTSALGTVTIRWNGLAAGSATMPADLNYVKVWQTGVTPFIGSIPPGGGYVTVGGLVPGATHSFALSAIDKLGNESAKTSYLSITVVSAATDAGIQAQLTAIAADIHSDVTTEIGTATNGLAKIIYSASAASGTGYPTGSTWFQRGSGNLIIAQWEFTAGAWVSKTVDSAVIANLDAGKVSFGEMDGIRLKAGTIRAGALSVGLQSNLIVDAALLDATIRTNRAGNGFAYDATNLSMTSTTLPTSRVSWAAGGLTEIYSDLIQVVPGEKYLCSAVVYSSIANTVQFQVQGYNQTGTANASLTNTTATAVTAATVTTIGHVFTVPAGMYWANVGVGFTSASASTRRVSQVAFVKQVPAVVIEDGAITAPKIATDAVTANAIQAGSIDGMIVTGATLRTAASGARVEMTSAGIRLFNSSSVVKAWMNPANGQLRIYSTGDLSHSSTAHGFQVGDDASTNLALDENEIMARDAGGYATLGINREGGGMIIGGRPGGYVSPDIGDISKNDDHHTIIRSSVEIQNRQVGDYDDTWSPLMVGWRGSDHLWLDHDKIGASGGLGANPIYINPSYGDGSTHVQPVWLGSNSIAIRRIGPAQGGVFSTEASVCLQLTGGQVNSRDASVVGNRSMGATAFNVISQMDTKKDIQDIPDPVALLKAVKSRKWRFKDEVNPEESWHFGPILEDLPDEMHIEVDDRLGYDIVSLTGILWEACRYLLNRLETVEGQATDILTNHISRLNNIEAKGVEALDRIALHDTYFTQAQARITAAEAKLVTAETVLTAHETKLNQAATALTSLTNRVRALELKP